MDVNNSENFIEEILNYLGYKKTNKKNDEDASSEKKYCKIDRSGGLGTNCCKDINLDIPNGFQDVDPVLFIVVGELIGNIIAGSVPFNVANAISNYLNLIGQIIETYAVQQAYSEYGPGRYYSPLYKNVSNPFMSCVDKDTDGVSNSYNKEDICARINNLEVNLNTMKESFSHDINDINLIIDKINNNLL